MEAYTGFAAVYDIFMDNVPYEEWSSYLHGLLLEHGIEEGIVLDLGCGTGAMTERLAAFGYDRSGQFRGYAGACHGKKSTVRAGYSVSVAGYAGI